MAGESAILVCTVGGSHQPILTALQARRWDLVIFVCTAETERSRGSVAMVEREIVVTRSTQAPVETLPPLPVLAGLDRDSWEVLEVPADDPDAIFAALLPRLRALARDHAGARTNPCSIARLCRIAPRRVKRSVKWKSLNSEKSMLRWFGPYN